jgi:hypothetical protein
MYSGKAISLQATSPENNGVGEADSAEHCKRTLPKKFVVPSGDCAAAQRFDW